MKWPRTGLGARKRQPGISNSIEAIVAEGVACAGAGIVPVGSTGRSMRVSSGHHARQDRCAGLPIDPLGPQIGTDPLQRTLTSAFAPSRSPLLSGFNWARPPDHTRRDSRLLQSRGTRTRWAAAPQSRSKATVAPGIAPRGRAAEPVSALASEIQVKIEAAAATAPIVGIAPTAVIPPAIIRSAAPVIATPPVASAPPGAGGGGG
jgi:hypothetical protein